MSPETRKRRAAPAGDAADALGSLLRRAADQTEDAAVAAWLKALASGASAHGCAATKDEHGRQPAA